MVLIEDTRKQAGSSVDIEAPAVNGGHASTRNVITTTTRWCLHRAMETRTKTVWKWGRKEQDEHPRHSDEETEKICTEDRRRDEDTGKRRCMKLLMHFIAGGSIISMNTLLSLIYTHRKSKSQPKCPHCDPIRAIHRKPPLSACLQQPCRWISD